MSLAKKAIVALVALYILVLLSGFLLPDKTTVVRSVEITAEKGRVFKLISEHKTFQLWSPWAQKDPAMEVTYEGPNVGVGAIQHWRSGHPQVGSGTSTYIEYIPFERATTHLAFDQGGGDATLAVTEIDAKTVRVDWSFESAHNNVFERFIGFLFVEKMVGPDYESGLQALKVLAESGPAIKVREVSYRDGDVTLNGYIASPELSSEAPVVIVVHEWWGHNDYARKRADMLAELGYNAFAIDMYGDGKLASHPDDAKAFMMKIVMDSELLFSRFDSALTYINQDSVLSGKPVAAIGYCFGGAVVLSMARQGKPLRGVVSFHGGLAGLAPINTDSTVPSLVFNGEADPFVTREQIMAFQSDMSGAGLNFEFIEFAGAKHSFTVEGADTLGQRFGMPFEYDQAADQASWQRTKSFLESVFLLP